jgi:cytidine deaminase
MTIERQLELLDRARQAASQAYVPYSDFPVGAAVLTDDGSLYTGCNVEIASIGLTICAERSAVGAAICAGHREIVAVAVAAPKSLLTTPCGACRQVLNEFRPTIGDVAIVIDDGDRGAVVTLSGLLPAAFGPRNLETASELTDITSGESRDINA